MATIYRVEIVSEWINYTEEELKRLIEKDVNADSDDMDIRVTKVECCR
jgi:hypothetical protein